MFPRFVRPPPTFRGSDLDSAIFAFFFGPPGAASVRGGQPTCLDSANIQGFRPGLCSLGRPRAPRFWGCAYSSPPCEHSGVPTWTLSPRKLGVPHIFFDRANIQGFRPGPVIYFSTTQSAVLTWTRVVRVSFGLSGSRRVRGSVRDYPPGARNKGWFPPKGFVFFLVRPGFRRHR